MWRGFQVVWKEECMKVELQFKKFQFIHAYFTPIYASPNDDNRRVLWEDLKNIAASMHSPWMLAGDFNDIASEEEKKGGVVVSIRKCNIFKNRINDCNWMDLGAVGSKFT
jgi:hypothetical protein